MDREARAQTPARRLFLRFGLPRALRLDEFRSPAGSLTREVSRCYRAISLPFLAASCRGLESAWVDGDIVARSSLGAIAETSHVAEVP